MKKHHRVTFAVRGLVLSLWIFALSPALSWAELAFLNGQLIQGGMIWGQVSPGSEVSLGPYSVQVGERGIFAAGFDRDAPATVALNICLNGECEVRELEIEQREYSIQRVNGVPQKTVTPPQEVLARVEYLQPTLHVYVRLPHYPPLGLDAAAAGSGPALAVALRGGATGTILHLWPPTRPRPLLAAE